MYPNLRSASNSVMLLGMRIFPETSLVLQVAHIPERQTAGITMPSLSSESISGSPAHALKVFYLSLR